MYKYQIKAIVKRMYDLLATRCDELNAENDEAQNAAEQRFFETHRWEPLHKVLDNTGGFKPKFQRKLDAMHGKFATTLITFGGRAEFVPAKHAEALEKYVKMVKDAEFAMYTLDYPNVDVLLASFQSSLKGIK